MCDRCEVIRTQNTVASRPKNTLLGYTERDVTMDDVPQSGVRVRASKKSLLDCCNSQWKPSYPTPTPQNLEGLCAKTIKLALWQESPFYTVSRCFEVWNLYPLSFFQSSRHSFCPCLLLSDNARVFRRFLFPWSRVTKESWQQRPGRGKAMWRS